MTKSRVEEWCKNNSNCPYFETSAKTADHVKNMFEAIGEQVIDFQLKQL